MITPHKMISMQAMKIEDLNDQLADLKARIHRAKLHLICIGGPLNDNRLGYSRAQMVTFQRIADELGD